jgi:hypothetical protein
MVSPAGVNLMALPTKFISTCLKRVASLRTARPDSAAKDRVCDFFSANGRKALITSPKMWPDGTGAMANRYFRHA